MLTSLQSARTWFSSPEGQETFLLLYAFMFAISLCLMFSLCHGLVLSRNRGWALKLTPYLYLTPSYFIMWCDGSLFNEAQWLFGLHQFDRVIWKIIRQLRTVISSLSPSGYFAYLHVYYLKILHSAHTVQLCASFGPHKNKMYFPTQQHVAGLTLSTAC